MENIILKIEHLSHRYVTQWAIRDINLEFPSKGIFGILGSNGAGKSTLMNIICGVIKPTEGKVWIDGQDILKNPIEAKRHIGFLPQKPPLYGDLTVEEYLHHAADIRYISKKDIPNVIDEVLELCAISHFRKRLIKNLSGGYQQRVGIAQAIIHKPAIVVLDEPTNGLDPNQIIEIRRLIQKIAEERIVLLSTHVLREVHAMCDQIIMVERGELVFVGTSNEFDNYLVPESLFLAFASDVPIEEIRRLGGVLQVEQLAKGKFRVNFSDSREVMEQVVEQSAGKRWHLFEMHLEQNSLNDVFAELSKKNK